MDFNEVEIEIWTEEVQSNPNNFLYRWEKSVWYLLSVAAIFSHRRARVATRGQPPPDADQQRHGEQPLEPVDRWGAMKRRLCCVGWVDKEGDGRTDGQCRDACFLISHQVELRHGLDAMCWNGSDLVGLFADGIFGTDHSDAAFVTGLAVQLALSHDGLGAAPAGGLVAQVHRIADLCPRVDCEPESGEYIKRNFYWSGPLA